MYSLLWIIIQLQIKPESDQISGRNQKRFLVGTKHVPTNYYMAIRRYLADNGAI